MQYNCFYIIFLPKEVFGQTLIKETTGFPLRGSNVQYRTSIAPDLWAAEVDKGQISQAVGNLVIITLAIVYVAFYSVFHVAA